MKEPLHIAAIGDIHGCLKNTYIPKCDVLTISGDFSELCLDRQTSYDGPLCGWITNKFLPWMISLPCDRVIFIPGNHDFITEHDWFKQWFNTQLEVMDKNYPGTNEDNKPSRKIVYLCYDLYEYKGYKFYGCPTSDILNWAWSANNDYTKYKVPAGTDILLVHQAPDWMDLGTSHFGGGVTRNFGSTMLLNALADDPKNLPTLLLCGHIHSGNHQPVLYELHDEDQRIHSCVMANVSTKDEDYYEHFHCRNFILTPVYNQTHIETWVSPVEDLHEIKKYNRRDNFIV